jgi:hypothetical protein
MGTEQRKRAREQRARGLRLIGMLEWVAAECDAEIARARELVERARALGGQPLPAGVSEPLTVNRRRRDRLNE